MHVLIIGNGISGITAARHIRKRSDYQITVVSAESDYFFSRTALMYIYMGHMRYEHTMPYEKHFWKKNRIELKRALITKIDFKEKNAITEAGEKIPYDYLILALGSKPNKFGWPGQDLPGVQGLYSLQDLHLLEENTIDAEKAVIVGGGLIGIELAEMLLSRSIGVDFLVRENSFWDIVLPKEESEMINRHIREHHISLHLNTELQEIVENDKGRASQVITNLGQKINCDLVGLTAGVHPNISFLRSSALKIDRGIIVNEYLETNIEGVYALGDCAQLAHPQAGRRSIEAVWYTGKMMGETVAATICGSPTSYNPGNWFNSAKFLDIEYQTYGAVATKPLPTEEQFYWEHHGGKKALRLAYRKEDQTLLGINAMGMRLRHSTVDKWLSEKRNIDYVIQHLEECNFDPEFYRKSEGSIRLRFYERQDKMARA